MLQALSLEPNEELKQDTIPSQVSIISRHHSAGRTMHRGLALISGFTRTATRTCRFSLDSSLDSTKRHRETESR